MRRPNPKLKAGYFLFAHSLLAALALTFIAPHASAQTDTGDWRFVQLPAPEFKRTTPRAVRPAAKGQRLVLVSSKPNKVTDERDWFERNKLALPVYEVTGAPVETWSSSYEPLPAFVPTSYRGLRLVEAVRQPRSVLVVYGRDFSETRYLVSLDRDTGRFRYGFDFSNYSYPPDYVRADRDYVYQTLKWAAEDGDTLYVSHGHMTYARSSKGMNAYLTAIDTRAGRVLWRSAPLVSNSANFEIIGDHIITGYGFTREPDYLYLLDKRTGDVRQQLAVASGPTYIIRKGDRIHVRAYDKDLVLRLARAR